jgi:hypothetical protein
MRRLGVSRKSGINNICGAAAIEAEPVEKQSIVPAKTFAVPCKVPLQVLIQVMILSKEPLPSKVPDTVEKQFIVPAIKL